MLTTISKKTYPNFPAIAKHLKIAVISLVDYEVWSDIFFIKIAGVGWRFVSKTFTRGKVKVKSQAETDPWSTGSRKLNEKGKPIIKAVKSRGEKQFRVIKTWDNESFYYGERIISVLVQAVGAGEKPVWDWVFQGQNIERDDILEESGTYLVKSQKTFAEAMGLY